jgi:hypothetical protein
LSNVIVLKICILYFYPCTGNIYYKKFQKLPSY